MKKKGFAQEIVLVFVPLLIVLFFCPNASAEEKTALLDTNGLEWDEMPQYLYNYDYNLSEVNITYETCANTFKGRLIGRNLKPNFTYQMKIFGKPCCYYSQGCDNESNERIGYLGRWWDLNKSGANKNINDNEYEANKDIHCIFGYLVFDHFTTDVNGDIAKDFECNSSYHVLWCNCTGEINNHDLADGLCPECAVGEPEAGRPAPGTLVMPEGDYNVRFTLTEECFHQGWNWSSVLSNDSIEFTIVRPVICGDVTGDGYLRVSDGIRIIANQTFVGDPQYFIDPWVADVTGDGNVRVSDGIRIIANQTFVGDPQYFLNCCDG
jgi:hypothetical protein